MNKAEIKTRIAEEIEKTEKLIKEYTELSQPVSPDTSIGRLSRMDAINNKSVTESALREARSKLSNLQIAWKKVDDPDFGICAKCKKPIPPGRIMLMPHARFCVNCA